MSNAVAKKAKTVRAAGGVSIVKRGGKFYVRFRDHEGIRRMRFAGLRMDEAKQSAKKEAGDIERRREAILSGKAIDGPAQRFEDFVKEYRPVLATTMRPATLRVIDTQIIAFDRFLKTQGDPTLDKVKRSHADAYLAAEAARGCATTYLSRQVWALERLWRGAVERGIAAENPFADRTFDRTTKYEVPYVTSKQLDAIVAAVRPGHRDIVAVVAATGVRIGEAIGLAWKDCDLDDGKAQIHVSRQGPDRALLKTPAARRAIPLPPKVAALLRRRRAAAVDGVERVFSENDTRQYILRSLHAACETAKAPRLRLHDLRHVFASHLVQAGVAISTVARLLGHADGGALVAKRYGRWQPQDAEALAMDRLTAFRAGPSAASRRKRDGGATARHRRVRRATRGTPRPS